MPVSPPRSTPLACVPCSAQARFREGVGSHGPRDGRQVRRVHQQAHEGFALHDSKVTTFDGKDFTGRDLFKEIVAALRAEGLRVGVYHSVIDWHHPDYLVRGTGLPHPLQHERNKGLPNPDANRVMNRYVDFLHQQVEEIVTRYGKIDVLWWDWSSKETQGESWRSKELLSIVRKHQPKIVMNNRLYWSPTWKATI